MKKKRRNRRYSHRLFLDKEYIRIGKKIHSYEDALRYFLPKNLAYLTSCKNSPFYIKKLRREKKGKQHKILLVPKCFSIIDNAKESYDFLSSLISAFLFQTCNHIQLDYKICEKVDLATQVFLDSILLDIDKFIILCKRANIYNKYVRLSSFGGFNIENKDVIRLLYSVGSPAELTKRRVKFKDVHPYRLKRFDEDNLSSKSALAQKEIDTTTLLDYVNSCLLRVGKTLKRETSMDLGCVIGETLINAEEHSSLKYRYLIGYFEECTQEGKHFGLLNLVIMNFGQTIYEKFKEPIEGSPVNKECLDKMQHLSD